MNKNLTFFSIWFQLWITDFISIMMDRYVKIKTQRCFQVKMWNLWFQSFEFEWGGSKQDRILNIEVQVGGCQ